MGRQVGAAGEDRKVSLVGREDGSAENPFVIFLTFLYRTFHFRFLGRLFLETFSSASWIEEATWSWRSFELEDFKPNLAPSYSQVQTVDHSVQHGQFSLINKRGNLEL